MNVKEQKTHLGKPYSVDSKDKTLWTFKDIVDGVEKEVKTWNDPSKRGGGNWKCSNAKCGLKVESSAKQCPCCGSKPDKKKSVNPLNTMSDDQVTFIASLTKRMMDGTKPAKPKGSCPSDSDLAAAVMSEDYEKAKKLAETIQAFKDWESFSSITDAKMKKYTDAIQKVIK